MKLFDILFISLARIIFIVFLGFAGVNLIKEGMEIGGVLMIMYITIQVQKFDRDINLYRDSRKEKTATT